LASEALRDIRTLDRNIADLDGLASAFAKRSLTKRSRESLFQALR
jgi:hypothetical protein